MPKIKTHRAAAKRFGLTGTGKFKRSKAFKRHKLEKKTSSRKRNLSRKTIVSKADEGRLRKLLPYL
ncbi:MAG: 50S ribosomal protein L35 [bacterium]|jgi:large subunit ribosomal protein L35